MGHPEVNFNFKARYFKAGVINKQTTHIWFVLHGYGQLAEYFIRKFKSLENSKTCIIAPEGLSRFYRDETSRRVGASWMTKENRLADIENYISYLNSVYKIEIPKDFNCKITVLGFSQGAATASRWVIDNTSRFDRLILWSGIFPPDLDFEKGKKLLSEIDIVEVYGNKDPYLTDERYQEMIQLNKQLNLEARMIEFDGGHDIDENALKQLTP